MQKILTYSIVVLILAACGKDIVTPIGQPPIGFEKNSTVGEGLYCKPDSSGQFKQDAVKIDQATTNSSGHLFALGGGCILKSISDAWKASQKQSFFVWNKSNLDGVTSISHPEAVQAFSAQHSAGPALFAVHWTMEWYHFLKEGTVEIPQQILIQYGKVRGTDHIRFWEGKLELTSLTPTVTSVVIQNEIDADRTNLSDCVSSVGNLLEKMRN